MDRTTVWRWLNAGHIPGPKRVGLIPTGGGRKRSRATRWHGADIELFARVEKPWVPGAAANRRPRTSEAPPDSPRPAEGPADSAVESGFG